MLNLFHFSKCFRTSIIIYSLDYLNYDTKEKNIYGDISDAIFSLTWLNYLIYEYKNSIEVKPIREDGISYTFGIAKPHRARLTQPTIPLPLIENKIKLNRHNF